MKKFYLKYRFPIALLTTCVTFLAIIILFIVGPTKKNVTVPIPIIINQTIVIHELKSADEYICSQQKDCRLLAEAIYYEARGEDLKGQIAVGWVIVNRSKSKYFPDTISEVVTQACQFSYRCDGSLNLGFKEKEAYEQSQQIAKGIILGIFKDPTNGADHYLNLNKVKRVPNWAKVYPQVASIGNHSFHIRNN